MKVVTPLRGKEDGGKLLGDRLAVEVGTALLLGVVVGREQLVGEVGRDTAGWEGRRWAEEVGVDTVEVGRRWAAELCGRRKDQDQTRSVWRTHTPHLLSTMANL